MSLRGWIKIRNITDDCDKRGSDYSFSRGMAEVSKKFKISADEKSIESGLLAVYDEIEYLKRDAQAHRMPEQC